MAETHSTPNRRTVLASLATTPVVALPAVAEALPGRSDELEHLIEAHKRAREAWLPLAERDDAACAQGIPSGFGFEIDNSNSLTRDVCKYVLKSLYCQERERLIDIKTWNADLARDAREKLDAREEEYLANADRIFDEKERADEDVKAGIAADKAALLAIAAYPARTLQEAQRKAAYILADFEGSVVESDVAKQMLRSFVSTHA
jgi:hypothetical protein